MNTIKKITKKLPNKFLNSDDDFSGLFYKKAIILEV